MNIEARKYNLIARIMRFDEQALGEVEDFLKEELDPNLEQELTARAIQSEKDIAEGKVYSLDEAEQRINRRFGL